MNKWDIKLASTFGGVNARHPEKGDRVKVQEGHQSGETFRVLLVDGYAFSPVYRIYVRNEEGHIFWYWPWNLEILPNP